MTCLAHHNRLTKAAVLGLVVIASTACLAQGRAIGPDPFRGGSAGPSGGSGEIRIQIRNSNFNEATVYAVRVGNRRRLGRVQGATDQQFRMPWPYSAQLHFEVDLLASRGCTTQAVILEPGQRVMLVIDSSSRPRSSGRNNICDIQPLR
jgi:hypothetical protein